MDKKEKFETAILSGISSLPYIGGGISSVYSSIKAEKETQRIDKFFEVIGVELERLDAELSKALQSATHDDEYLAMLIEKICEKVEREAREIKRQNFKTLFINSLINGINSLSYDFLDFYTESLDALNEIDIEILILLFNQDNLVPVSAINHKQFNDPYFILASINKLRNFGFIESFTGEFHVGARDNSLHENVRISRLGKDFSRFCLDW